MSTENNTIESIRGQKIAVQCLTKNEAASLLKAVDYYHSYNYSNSIVSGWDGEDTCYVLNAAGASGIGRGKTDYYAGEGFEIIPLREVVSPEMIKQIDTWRLTGELKGYDNTIAHLEAQLEQAKSGRKSVIEKIAQL